MVGLSKTFRPWGVDQAWLLRASALTVCDPGTPPKWCGRLCGANWI